MKLVGIYYVLFNTNIWVMLAVLWFVVDKMTRLIRKKTEGFDYQIARTPDYGDPAIVTALLMTVSILQSQPVEPPALFNNLSNQVLACIFFTIVGGAAYVATKESRSGRLGDLFHDIVLFPILLFLVVALLPILWTYGSWIQIAAVPAIATFMSALLWHDTKHNKLKQREYLLRKGVPVKG
jgi:hypothetical protein